MQALSVDQLVGQNVGNYRVMRLLGRGRLSAVYLAEQPTRNITVALTTYIIPDRLAAEARERFLQRFMKEAAVLVTLDHPNILPVYGYGEQFGYPYLVTPYMMNGSLTDILRQQGRCTPSYVQEPLAQVAAGLDYAYSKGVVHGTLKPANVLLSEDQSMLVAGFGLMHMLQVRGIERNEQPNAHLLSIADTFLAAPEYIAPEVVQGQPVDRRSDIYALGIILFELLSGKAPFTGANPMDVAMLHIQQTVPSLHRLHPDIPIALESVVNQALAPRPAQRFQSAAELAQGFEQVCRGILAQDRQGIGRDVKALIAEPKTLPGDFLQEVSSDGFGADNWQLNPPVVTGKTFALRASSAKHQAQSAPIKKENATDSWQLVPPIVTGHVPAVQRPPTAPAAQSPMVASQSTATRPGPQTAISQVVTQPPIVPTQVPESAPLVRSTTFPASASMPAPPLMPRANAPIANNGSEWWSHTSAAPASLPMPEPSRPYGEPAYVPVPMPSNRTRQRPTKKRAKGGVARRQVLATLVAGGVIAAGAVVATNANLLHMIGIGNPAAPTQPTARGRGNPAPTPATKQTPGQGAKPTPKASPTAAAQKTAPAQTATVIGNSAMKKGTTSAFTNPADNKASLLIRLPQGTFVAFEQACTHQGVTVAYDAAANILRCPLHGATFDAANGGQVLVGPATVALPTVAIKVNADGTITAGK